MGMVWLAKAGLACTAGLSSALAFLFVVFSVFYESKCDQVQSSMHL